MSSDKSGERHSKAASPELVTDPHKKAELEARNALRQFDTAIEAIEDWLKRPGERFCLRASLIQGLHRVALDGLSAFAGNWRPATVEIEGSAHEPVGAHLIPEEIEHLCDYVNDNWESHSAIHLCAYVMWRLNWIHPFDDGNGRTSRAVSYVVLCCRLQCQLPGRFTIPEQISLDKKPYYDALEAADAAWRDGRIDVSGLEALLEGMLANQLLSIHREATGSSAEDQAAPSSSPKFH